MKNSYSNFITPDDIQKELIRIKEEKDIEKGGLPLCYDNESIYLDSENGHTLVIGHTGSGKTQSCTLPKLWTSILAGENILVDDPKGELYERLSDDLSKQNYKVITFDFQDFSGKKWNPLKLAFDLYKENNIDDAVMILEKVAYYLLKDINNDNVDPFWFNSAVQLFVGTSLYLMEKEESLITISEVIDCANKLSIDDYNKLDGESPAKVFLRVIMTSPEATRGSIVAVFNSSISCFSYKNRISDFISSNDFDIKDTLNEKVAVFIIDGHTHQYITNLIALYIEELFYVCTREKNKNKINILIDDFNDYIAFDSFSRLLANSRSVAINFMLLTGSLRKLSELYGEVALDYIISYFNKIIYLLANEDYTLEYISNMCGNKNNEERLISKNELKLLKPFEAIVLKSRHLPLRTKLLPFYQYHAK